MNETKLFDFTLEPGKVLEKKEEIGEIKPLISIISAYYNVQDYIMQTAYSIFNQTFPYWEWIIVDDGSKEENKKILDTLKAMDSRVKVYYNSENLKLPKTRDVAISKATTDYLFILDPDDLIDKTALETAYFAMKTHPEVTWVCSDSVGFGAEEYLWRQPFDMRRLKKYNMLCVNALIKKQAVLDVGGYSNVPPDVYEDWHLWLRLLANGASVLKMSHFAFWYRRRANGVLSGINSDKEKRERALKEIAKVGKNINDDAVKAIQYPITDNYKPFGCHPKEFDFEVPYIKKDKNKKRILCIFPWLVLGGADKFNLNLLEKLKEEGYEVTIVTTVASEYVWRQRFEKYATEIFDLTTFLDKKDWPAFIDYLVKSRNYDLIFQSNSEYGYYLIPWLKCRYPEMPIIDYVHMEEWHWRDGGYPRDSIAMEKYLDYTYTCSAYLIDIMKEQMNKKKDNIDVVYIGTDEKSFNPEIVEEPTDSELEKLKDKKKVLFTCRIAEQKRPVLMIEILRKLVNVRKDIGFVVVGDGNMLPMIKEMADTYGIQDNIAFLGQKKDVRPYYKIADATLICSMIEGLSLTSYESLVMGVPVVSADVGGQKELIDEKCGRIIKLYQNPKKNINDYDYSDEEIDEYVNAIIDVIDNGEELRKNCRSKILERFTIEKMQENMLDIIQKRIEKGTEVKYEDIKEDANLAERILVMHNEINRAKYVEDHSYLSRKERFAAKMWKYKAYRDFIKFVKKFK